MARRTPARSRRNDGTIADVNRSPHIDVIDIRYWTYTKTGELYSPAGGQHLSPRQHLRQEIPASTSFESIVRSIREYHLKFPEKCITYNAHIHCRAKRNGWAILIGGGSIPNIPRLSPELATALVSMKPDVNTKLNEGQWCLSDDRGYLVYSRGGHPSPIQLPAGAIWEWSSVDPQTGRTRSFRPAENGTVPVDAGLVWIRRL